MSRSGNVHEEIRPLGRDVLALMAAGAAISVLMAWTLSSYFRIDVAGSLIWSGDDGYCNASTEGLGVHCFSDLAMYLGLGVSMDPEGLSSAVKFYPPLNRFSFFIFQLLGAYLGQWVAVALYVSLSVVSLLSPALWASRRRPRTDRILIVSLIGILTFPFLATIDRGNNVAFLVPIVLVFVVAMADRRYGLAISMLVVGSQLKPQLGVLALGFLVIHRYRDFFVAVGASFLIFVASFLMFLVTPGKLSPLQEFKDFILFTRYFDELVPLTQTYPLNISFVHLLGIFWEAVGLGSADADVLQWFVYGSVGLALITILWRGARLGLGVWFPAMLMGILLTPNPVFAYYMAGALIVVTFFFREPFVNHVEAAPRSLRWVLVSAVVASLVPLVVPVGWADSPLQTLGEGVVVSALPRAASLLWFIYLIAVAVVAARTSRKLTEVVV